MIIGWLVLLFLFVIWKERNVDWIQTSSWASSLIILFFFSLFLSTIELQLDSNGVLEYVKGDNTTGKLVQRRKKEREREKERKRKGMQWVFFQLLVNIGVASIVSFLSCLVFKVEVSHVSCPLSFIFSRSMGRMYVFASSIYSICFNSVGFCWLLIIIIAPSPLNVSTLCYVCVTLWLSGQPHKSTHSACLSSSQPFPTHPPVDFNAQYN